MPEDMSSMEKEVEDILSGDSSSSDEDPEGGTNKTSGTKSKCKVESSESEDSLTGEVPRGHKRKKPENDSDDDLGMIDRFRRGEGTPSDYEIESQSDDEDGFNQNRGDYGDDNMDEEDDNEEDDELGAQLER